MNRRSIGLALALGITLVRDRGRPRRRLAAARGARSAAGDARPHHGALGADRAGLAALAADPGGPRAALRLARARDPLQPAPAGVPRRRHPRDEDAARGAAPLPRDARPARPRRGAPPLVPRRAWTRTWSGSSAPSAQVLAAARAERCGARAPPEPTDADARCCTGSPTTSGAATRCPSDAIRDRPAPPALGARRRHGAGPRLPQPARERGQVLRAAASRCASTSSRTRTAACAPRSPTAASASSRASCARSSSASTAPARDVQRQAAGLGPRPVHRAQPGAPQRRSRRGAVRGLGPRQPLRGDAARGARRRSRRGARDGGPGRRGVAMSRVLVVEDEAHLAEGLAFNLEAEGYEVEVLARRQERRGARAGRAAARPRDPRRDAARADRASRSRAARAPRATTCRS